MKICIATHHFPPKYFAGAELYAFLLAKHLIGTGNEVEVVTIESIEDGELDLRCEIDVYQGIKVNRLFFNHYLAERPFQLLYKNPYLGEWFGSYLTDFQPEMLHVNSGYLLGGTIIEEAKKAGLPVALTLHEYWFLCPINSLLQTSGRVCSQPVPASQCKWCLLAKKRRFRVIDQKLNGKLGDAFSHAISNPLLSSFAEQDEDIRDINDRRTYLRQVFQMVDLVISPSKFLIEKMKAYGFHHPNMIQLPYGLETIPAELPDREESPEKLRIGYRGRISPEKGIDILIEAFKKVTGDQLSLLIYGDINERMPYDRYLLKMAREDRRIHFMGRYSNRELPKIMEGIDISVVPSRWYENQPYTILESFAYGIPVIATNLGGMSEMIVDGGNGLLFELNNVKDLANQLQRFVSDPGLLACLRRGIMPVPRVEDEIRRIEDSYRLMVPV
jgi:glycosyltransferase involved in cell wall biosynthesis